jgi:pimeloyl-ACP methyl ester carboxylesterase
MNTIYAIAQKFIWRKYTDNGFLHLAIQSEDLFIDYWDNHKEAKTVILLHGFGAQAEFQWYKQVETLAKQYRVIIPNLLYFGKTRQNEKYQLQHQVDFVDTLVQHLGLVQFDLVGISYGGLIAVEYCQQNISFVNKLVVIDAPIKYFTNEDLQQVCKRYDLDSILDLFAPMTYIGLKKQFRAAYYAKPLIPNFIYKILFDNLCLPNIEHWKKLIVALNAQLDFYAERDYTFEQQTLLIWGAKDDIVPSSIGYQLNQHLKNSSMELIDKAKHLPNIEKPNQFNQILTDFLTA